MFVEVESPARKCTNAFVVAVGVVEEVESGVGLGDGLIDGDGIGVDLGLAVTVGDGVSIGLSNASLAIVPRPPMASDASVRPAASNARISTPPRVASTLLISAYW